MHDANADLGLGPELYPGQHAELRAREQKETALRDAAAVPLPGPLRQAFSFTPPRLYGLTLQPVTAGLAAILCQLDNPFYRTVQFFMRNAGTNGVTLEELAARAEAEIQSTPESEIETVFCFTTPGRQLRELLAQGRPAFREAAYAALADKLTPPQLMVFIRACGAHWANSFATVQTYEAAAPPSPDGTIFTKPSTSGPMGSAGSST